jgi:hypothetical protein
MLAINARKQPAAYTAEIRYEVRDARSVKWFRAAVGLQLVQQPFSPAGCNAR